MFYSFSLPAIDALRTHLEYLTEFLERHPGRLRQRFALEAPELVGDLLKPDSAGRRQRHGRQRRVAERKVEPERRALNVLYTKIIVLLL